MNESLLMITIYNSLPSSITLIPRYSLVLYCKPLIQRFLQEISKLARSYRQGHLIAPQLRYIFVKTASIFIDH